MKQSSVIAHVRQLCCLGVNSEALIPELIKSIRLAIPAVSGTFNWVGAKEEVSRAYMEHAIAPVMELFVNEAAHLFSDPRTSILERAIASSNPVGNFIYLREQGFYQTDMYHLICRPHNLHYALEVVIRCNDQVNGMLALWRSRDDKNFTDKSAHVMSQLLPYLSGALSPIKKTTQDHEQARREGSGLIILDKKGKIQHLCHTARSYVLQATHPCFNYSLPKAHSNIDINHAMSVLCKKIVAVFQGKDCGAPVHCIKNPFGAFVFRGYFLDGVLGGSEQVIGVTVEKLVPKQLKIIENVRKYEFSPKQSQIAFLVANGYSNAEIATRLSVSVNTVRDHLDKIYNKLDFVGRQELANRLSL